MAQTNGKDSPVEQVEKERKFLGGLLEGLSVPQVAAGALAAVTSMLLSAKIGIAGSVIGVAVGSVVSTLSSQIYKQFLQASADKLRELSPVGDAAGDGAAEEAAGEMANAAGVSAGQASMAGATRVMDPAATRLMSQVGQPGAAAGSEAAGETPTRTVADLRAEGETGVLRGRAEHLRRQRVQRGVIAVSVVSALIAVAVSAFVIDLVTAGEGVGAKTEPLFSSTSTEQSADAGSAKASKQQAATNQDASGSQSSESAQNQGNPVHQDATASESDAADVGQQGSASDSASGSSQSGSSAGSTSGNASGSGSASGSQGAASGSGSSGSSGSAGSTSGSSSGSSASGNDSASGSGAANGSSQSSSASGSSGSANGSSTSASTSANAS